MWLVLAGRCPLPSWLTRPYVNGRLSVLPEEDLRLSEKDIAQLYLSWGVQLPRNLLEKRIIPLVEGNPLGARLLAVEMSQGSSYTEELVNGLTRKFYEYLNQAIYSEWPEEIREMMMQLSLLEHFTIQQAEEMTGRSDVNRLLAQAAEMGNLFSIKDGGYTLRPAVINSMKLRMETVCDRVRKNELLRRAGTICEKEGNIPRALKLYQDGQCEKEIHALLIDNARRYPGGGYYYELTPAYLALPEEEVRSSPDLIAARSMLYSLALNATESERWYAVLQEYAAGHPDPEEHRLAESWLVYLDISLPHRGSTNLIEVLDEAARKIQTERLVMPEFSVTGGQPSVINGSKDFCDWTRDDQTMAFQLEKHVGEVLGPYSKGLVSIGLAESLFEKGGNIYKVLELANRGLMETMNGGKFELQFVGAALVARVYLVTGHPGDSVKTLEEMETRAQQRGARRVVRNVRAMQSRIKLWQGRVEDAVRWMENEPQDEIHFNVLERYCYNTFVRVYMAQQRYDKTVQILMRLRSYANMEKRPWLQMEGDLLESIIRYRTGNPLWKTELTQVLRRAESYHFVRLFCREGAALLPLLEWSNPRTMGGLSVPGKIMAALFQSVSTRTAGMNTIDLAACSPISKLLMSVLQFIGAAPGSTGGGVKVTTFAVLILTIRSVAQGRDDCVIGGHHIESKTVYRALTIIVIGAVAAFGSAVVVYYNTAETVSVIDCIFESCSAFGTVGLSVGVTGQLNTGAKLLYMACMFMGRVGPVSLAISLTAKPDDNKRKVLPVGHINVG